MRLQQALELEPEFNGKIEYFERDGQFTYWFGYGARSWVKIHSDKNQSMWNAAEIAGAVERFRSEVEQR